jgi:hypothetical protein
MKKAGTTDGFLVQCRVSTLILAFSSVELVFHNRSSLLGECGIDLRDCRYLRCVLASV